MATLLPTPVRTVVRLAREAVYVGVGAGVLAVQRLQVQRREWERDWKQRTRTADPTP